MGLSFMLAQEYIQYKTDQAKQFDYEIVGSEIHLGGLKKINIFVGANNSGKSRFLRQMFTSNNEKFQFYENINKQLMEAYYALKSSSNSDKSHMQTVLNKLIELATIPSGDFINRYQKFIDYLKNTVVSNPALYSEIKGELKNKKIFSESISLPQKQQRVYIPILRGLRHLEAKSENNSFNDFYQNTTCTEYNFKGDFASGVFTGLSIYSDIKKMLLGSQEDRKLIRNFEHFLSESFFQKKAVTLIPDHDKTILKINIEGDTDRFIYELGDGIQSIIINTFKAFQHKDQELMLFIEEPELMMHPSVQRVLIETFVKRFDKLQVFLTTHSNHFLDLTYDYPDDVAIYSFEKNENKFYINNISANAKILDLLGVRNSSVFLANCVIWTEGVTDRMLLRKLLELKECEYKEDFHYTFAEYGGGNLENFNFENTDNSNAVFIQSISKKNYLIADNDNIVGESNKTKKNPKYIRRKKLEAILGNENFFDKHIEIENLIPYKVWSKVIELILKEKPNKEIKLKTAIDQMEGKFNKDLSKDKIGKVIKNHLIELKEGSDPKYFKSESIECLGEVKKYVMEIVIKVIDDLKMPLSDFPEEAQDLIESITKFIETANKKP